MAGKTGKEDAALAKAGQGEGGQALALAERFTALATGDLSTVREIIEGNFGKGQINFNDLDKVKLPGAGGTSWEVITLEGDASVPELRGIIVAWADKKVWWPVAMDDPASTGGPPVCRAETVWDNGRKGIGIGDPTISFNAKEVAMLDAPGSQFTRQPKKITGGWDCSTCIHNQFGTNAKHGGKACADKRPVMMLDEGSLLPFVVMLPATSIQPLREFFGRMARNGLPFFAAIISLKLEKDKSAGNVTYSKVVPTLVERLKAEHVTVARGYSQMLMPLLQGDAMNQPALYAEDQQRPTGGKGFDPLAASLADLITPKQLGLVEELARTRSVDANSAAAECFGQPVDVRELSKEAGSRLIDYLKDDVAVPDAPRASTDGQPQAGKTDAV